MPEAGYEKRDHGRNIIVAPCDAVLINATEYIRTQETGKGDVPSPPVILEVSCLVRRIKILRDVNIKHPAQAYGHIRISGQIKIVRYRILDGGEPGDQQLRVCGDGIEKVLRVRGHRIRKKDLFGASDGEQKQPERNVVIVELQVFRVFKLRDDLRMMNDRSHDQLWEERDKEQVIDKVILLGLTPVAVHQIVKNEIPMGRTMCLRATSLPVRRL